MLGRFHCSHTHRAQRHLQPYYSTSRQTPLPHSIRKAASGLPGCPRKQPCSCSALASSHDSASDKKTAVIIVDHGSRRPESNQQLEQFVQLYRESHGCESAFAAHMEIASPSIADGISRCAAEGFDRVVVAPYFLSQGRHIQQDIPELVAQAQKQHPGLECIIADPIGIDEAVAAVIHKRVQSAVAPSSAA